MKYSWHCLVMYFIRGNIDVPVGSFVRERAILLINVMILRTSGILI